MKPLLIGMNNPGSQKPEHAFYPWPPRCSGARILSFINFHEKMSGMDMTSRHDFLDMFDRMNVLQEPAWDQKAARMQAPRVLTEMRGRRSFVFGFKTSDALGLKRTQGLDFVLFDIDPTIEYVVLPHPSGMCRAYNDSCFKQSVGRMLLEKEVSANSNSNYEVSNRICSYCGSLRIGGWIRHGPKCVYPVATCDYEGPSDRHLERIKIFCPYIPVFTSD